MAVPVGAYVRAIATMMWRAAARVGGRTPARAAWIGLAGARGLRGERHDPRVRPLLAPDPRRGRADHGPLLGRPVRHRRLGGRRVPLEKRYAPRQGDRHEPRRPVLAKPSSPSTRSAPTSPPSSAATAGAPVAYFDGPGGTQVPLAVVDAMADYLLHHNANTHWAYPTSVETDAALAARARGPRRLPRRHGRPRSPSART